jgi:hypothetical protein
MPYLSLRASLATSNSLVQPTSFSSFLAWEGKCSWMDIRLYAFPRDWGNRIARNSSNDFTISRFHVFHSPVLPRPHFAQGTPEFHEPRIPLRFLMPFPSENLIDLGENEHPVDV